MELKDIPLICEFPQTQEELFYLFPKATYPLSVQELRDAIESRAESTVVEYDGEVAGFANFYRYDTEGICSIGNMVVSPAFRKRGVATFLVEHMKKVGFTKYFAAEITVSCFNENVGGLLLYPKLGFQPYAIEERKKKDMRRVALIHFRFLRTQFNSLFDADAQVRRST